MKTLFASLTLIIFMFTDFCANAQEQPIPLKVYKKNDLQVESYNFDGLEYFLNKNDSITYIINFWATWCGPCIEELPYFEEITKKYSENEVKVILVSLDMKNQIESRLLPFIEKRKLVSQVVYLDDIDANSWINKISPDWSGAIPATIIYKNKNRKFYERSFTFTELETEIKNIQYETN